MNDLFKEFEDFLDQGVEGLLGMVKTIEEGIDLSGFNTDFQVRRDDADGVDSAGRQAGPATWGADDAIATPPVAQRNTTANPSSGFAGIGGLTEVVRELRELVELPLKRPEVLRLLGLEPTTGVLLVGPPGTGKTLTARVLAKELGVNYIAIVGPEVMGKYYGEAEARLRSVFQKAARSAPCIVFIDEIDSLAPDRAKVDGEVEKRVVAQMLSLMDGFADTQGVIVVAATNRPDHLDPALRRPGRFDREVQFRVPDRAGKREILQVLTAAMPLAAAVDLDEVAGLAVGMVGADLKAVCQKAAYIALRRLLPNLNSPLPRQMRVTQADFLQAVKQVKPAVLRSIQIETPDVSWAEIGGLETVKQTLQEAVEGALLYPELYRQTRAQAPRGILLWGPPGTGKTLLAKAVAAQAQANFIAVNGPELMSRWVGASEQAVRELFVKARQAAPCVVFMDEIDSLAPARGGLMNDSGVSDRVVGQLLTELDGLKDCPNVLLIGATNRPEALDPALLRAGRLDLQIKIDRPDQASRLAILQVHNRERPLNGVELSDWAAQTEGWDGADLALLSNQAALESVRRYRSQGRSQGQAQGLDQEAIQISPDDFLAAYQRLAEQKANAQ